MKNNEEESLKITQLEQEIRSKQLEIDDLKYKMRKMVYPSLIIRVTSEGRDYRVRGSHYEEFGKLMVLSGERTVAEFKEWTSIEIEEEK